MCAISINSYDWDWSESEEKRPKPTPLPHMRLWLFYWFSTGEKLDHSPVSVQVSPDALALCEFWDDWQVRYLSGGPSELEETHEGCVVDVCRHPREVVITADALREHKHKTQNHWQRTWNSHKNPTFKFFSREQGFSPFRNRVISVCRNTCRHTSKDP